ncbi:ABC transporter permease [Micromonospora sp. KC207]|uniref:ABC transporter permease n=1 Tax=Micromonospora sp. KC207 TaxID=2530377 RepID=UPI00104F41DB|nr:ABC transporter permease [Micromonospora sp. KC207]TDC61063.1 ABC transporter permease [Micromonospora sp. KC207]
MIGDMAFRSMALIRHNVLLRSRDLGQLVSYLVMPMILMLVFKPLFVAALPNGESHAVIGLLVMFSVLSISVVASSLLSERTWRTWDRLRVTPSSTFELLLGKSVPILLILVLQQALLLLYGSQVIGMEINGSIGLFILAVLVWGLVLLAIGSALASIVRSHGELSAVSDIGALAVSALGGSFAPVEMMPRWAQAIAPFSPGYWAISMLKGSVRGDVAVTLQGAGILAVVGLLAGTFACIRLSRELSDLRS